MEDQGQVENPSDFSDPSVEKNERFLAIDEEITDDDDREIAAELKSQASGSSPAIESLRSLVCIDKSSKHFLHFKEEYSSSKGVQTSKQFRYLLLALRSECPSSWVDSSFYDATNSLAMQTFFENYITKQVWRQKKSN